MAKHHYRYSLSHGNGKLYLMVGVDPNLSLPEVIQVAGVGSSIGFISLRIFDKRLHLVFSQEYRNVTLNRSSLLEFYTYGAAGDHILSLRIENRTKRFKLKLK